MRNIKGYASWLNLATNAFPFNKTGKLALLWFDELILQVPDQSLIEKAVDYFTKTERCSQKTVDEFFQCLVPISTHINNYKFLSTPYESSMPEIIDVSIHVTKEETKKYAPLISDDDPGYIHEVAWASAGLIESVNLWTELNERFPCAFLAIDREQRVIDEVFFPKKEYEYRTFAEIITSQIPDFSQFTWERILDLRHHQYFENFRAKVAEIHHHLSDGQVVKEVVDEIILADLQEMVRRFRPNVGGSFLKALGSNLPLPTIINPISAGLSAYETYRAIDTSKRYGWLYFLLDNKPAR